MCTFCAFQLEEYYRTPCIKCLNKHKELLCLFAFLLIFYVELLVSQIAGTFKATLSTDNYKYVQFVFGFDRYVLNVKEAIN